MRLVFWNSIHLEFACSPFCLLINSSWLLVFTFTILYLFSLMINLYCWKGIHNNIMFSIICFIFLVIIVLFVLVFFYWFRDLLRELLKKYEVLLIILFLLFFTFLLSETLLFVSFFWSSSHSFSSPTLGTSTIEGFYLSDPCQLTFTNTLLLSNAAISLGNSFISLEISSSYFIFFTLFSFIFSISFISLQIKEFRIMALLINDSIYSCLFFILIGLHFYHLFIGLIILSLLFYSCSFLSLYYYKYINI